MAILPNEYNIDLQAVLTEEQHQLKILELWATESLTSDRFYQTGYETILYNESLSFAIETVLTSVMLWDKELLIIGSAEESNKVKMLAKSHSIDGHILSGADITGLKTASILKFFPQISHVLINIDSSEYLQSPNFMEVVQAAVNTGRDIIVTSTSQFTKLTDWFRNIVSFTVGHLDNIDKKSFVIARRNKLVQTEGNARSSRHDLYGYWQWSMRNRTSVIEPM